MFRRLAVITEGFGEQNVSVDYPQVLHYAAPVPDSCQSIGEIAWFFDDLFIQPVRLARSWVRYDAAGMAARHYPIKQIELLAEQNMLLELIENLKSALEGLQQRQESADIATDRFSGPWIIVLCCSIWVRAAFRQHDEECYAELSDTFAAIIHNAKMINRIIVHQKMSHPGPAVTYITSVEAYCSTDKLVLVLDEHVHTDILTLGNKPTSGANSRSAARGYVRPGGLISSHRSGLNSSASSPNKSCL